MERGLPKPSWVKIRAAAEDALIGQAKALEYHKLNTVCVESGCPNLYHCWQKRTVTFMVLGSVCTRACRFCATGVGNPRGLVDGDEPQRIADYVITRGLSYVVITSVCRDDLPDGGASIFAETVTLLREAGKVGVELLIPDFQGDSSALAKIVKARPQVIAHNIETVARLTGTVRDRRASYSTSLRLLADVKGLDKKIPVKSGIMLGLGESMEEVIGTMEDLIANGTDMLTLGQYLSPTSRHLPVVKYYTPQEFEALAEAGRRMGFMSVLAGPLVRSSFQAAEQYRNATSVLGGRS